MRFPRKAFLYALYVILVLLIVSALIVTFKPKKKTVTTPAPSNGSSQVTDKNKDGLSVSQGQDGSKLGTTTNPNNSATGTSSTSTTTPSTSNTASSSTAAAGKNTPANLAATGPKETIAVFIGASILGAAMYRRLLVKKLV